MGEIVIALGGPPKGKAAGGKPGGVLGSALADLMKKRGKPMDEEQTEDAEPSTADEAGKEAAQAFLDAVKDGDAEGVWEAFKGLCEAHEGYASDEGTETTDEEG